MDWQSRPRFLQTKERGFLLRIMRLRMVFSGRIYPVKSLKSAVLVMIVFLLSGCATQASLTVMSQPIGAFITEKGTGKAWGTTPITVVYDSEALLRYKGSDGCYHVHGFEARWVSGTVASLETVRFCGSNAGKYEIQFNRDSAQPGLDKDLQFSVQLQILQAQQKQAKAAQDAATAALFSAWADIRRTQVNCTSIQIGNTIQTYCR